MKAEQQSRYEDIIHLSHHVSGRHPQMPLADRAAQFAPFAALKGYDAAIREAARLSGLSEEPQEQAKWPEDSDF